MAVGRVTVRARLRVGVRNRRLDEIVGHFAVHACHAEEAVALGDQGPRERRCSWWSQSRHLGLTWRDQFAEGWEDMGRVAVGGEQDVASPNGATVGDDGVVARRSRLDLVHWRLGLEVEVSVTLMPIEQIVPQPGDELVRAEAGGGGLHQGADGMNEVQSGQLIRVLDDTDLAIGLLGRECGRLLQGGFGLVKVGLVPEADARLQTTEVTGDVSRLDQVCDVVVVAELPGDDAWSLLVHQGDQMSTVSTRGGGTGRPSLEDEDIKVR